MLTGFHPDLFNTANELGKLNLGQINSLNGQLNALKKAKNKILVT